MTNEFDNQIEEIEIIRNSTNEKWEPIVSEEIINLLNRIPINQESRNSVRDEAISIMSKCISPLLPSGQDTGLVLGYVQSGKTLSFTAVTALARDNSYPIIIVIAGTKIPLTHQSKNRLRKDLNFDSRNDRVWRHIHNPRNDINTISIISNIIDDWRDSLVSKEDKPTLLITVMKHHTYLLNLRNVLLSIDLNEIPVLIFDDEADQAGLNNLINQGDESTTYMRLRELKEVIPHHTFLQYTATPQGPLLINLIDVLSPGFAITITPGNDYIGGREFFGNANLIREIPGNEIPTNNNHFIEPPQSLIDALKIFFLGVTSGYIRERGRGNRSFMVHPSRRTDPHQQYYDWIINIINEWRRILENKSDPDYLDLKEEFIDSYHDLLSTVNDLEDFDRLFPILNRAIRLTEINIINARGGQTPEIDWRGAYAHIVVGGQALDRGFTVEGLTVTYMPRGIGSRQADTIQQRARFFGYKRSYLGYCRVFLERELHEAFSRYVAHEESIRNFLIENNNCSLRDLRREFLIPQGLRPTRDSIIDVDYVIVRQNQGWFYPKAPHDSNVSIKNNIKIINNFLQMVSLTDNEGHDGRTEIQKHLFSDRIKLSFLYEYLLLELRFTRLSDVQNFNGILILIRNLLLTNSNDNCSIYLMSHGNIRERSLNDQDELSELFQGEYPVYPRSRRGEIYPGDRAIHSEDNITIQIHCLKINSKDRQLALTVPIINIAIYIPQRLRSDILIQDQNELIENED